MEDLDGLLKNVDASVQARGAIGSVVLARMALSGCVLGGCWASRACISAPRADALRCCALETWNWASWVGELEVCWGSPALLA